MNHVATRRDVKKQQIYDKILDITKYCTIQWKITGFFHEHFQTTSSADGASREIHNVLQ